MLKDVAFQKSIDVYVHFVCTQNGETPMLMLSVMHCVIYVGNQERGRRLIGGRFAHAYRARPPGSPCPTYHWALTGAEHNSRRAVGMWTQHGADSLWLGVPCPSRASQHEHGPHITVGTGTSGRDIGVDWYSWFQGGNGPRRKRVRFRACGSPRAQPQRWGRRPRAQPQLWNHNSKIGRTQVFAGHILHRCVRSRLILDTVTLIFLPTQCFLGMHSFDGCVRICVKVDV